MSLRVLLADESPSIKKAFELALKDLAVQIQTVHHGVDVKELCSSFNPDICFLDILLPKKNGYDACTEIKKSSDSSPPVVLMWSSFMEIDEAKFKSSHADGRLEKPFETKSLRNLVSHHVQKLKNNQISQFIETEEVKDLQSQPNDQNFSEKTAVSLESEENEDLPPLGTEPANINSEYKGKGKGEAKEVKTSENNPPSLPEIPDLDSILDLKSNDTEKEDDDNDADHDFEEGSLKIDDHEDFQSLPSEFEVKQGNDFEELSSLRDSDSSFDADFDNDSDNDNDPDNDLFGFESDQVTSNATDNDDDLDTFKMEPLESFGDENEDFNSTPPPTFIPPPLSEISSQKNSPPQTSDQDQDDTEHEIETENEDSFYEETTDPSIELNKKSEDTKKLTDEEIQSTKEHSADKHNEENLNLNGENLNNDLNSEKNFNLDDQLSKDELKRLIMAQSKDIIENVVWDVVPELAKELIKKEIARLTGEIKPYENREEHGE